MKKALFVQLPVPTMRFPTVDANVPLGAGYLAAWARSRVVGWEFEILPAKETDLLGDELLGRAILAREPDLVCITLYLWNAERSLTLGERLRREGIAVAVGGPEVSRDNLWLRDHPGFDLGIEGEGEDLFARLLDSFPRLPETFGPARILPAGEPIDLAAHSSPYLTGLLEPSPDSSVWIETLRGCPFKCSYCNYGKRFGALRRFPDRWLSDHLAWSRDRGVREIYLMDPSFNVRPDFPQLLSTLERYNHDRALSLHTELVADLLKPGEATRLGLAGLTGCEIGLQTIDKEVLQGVGRSWRKGPWVRGVSELLDAGVGVVVGIIVGLPGDTLQGVERTLDFLLTETPGVDVQLFPLSLLPGTDLRLNREELGLEHLELPPYTVTTTRGFTEQEISEAFMGYEERTGLEFDPLPNPSLSGSWNSGEEPPYLSGVRVTADSPSGWASEIADLASNQITVLLDGWQERLVGELAELANRAGFTALTLVADWGIGWPVARLAASIEASRGKPTYLDRYYRHLTGGNPLLPRWLLLIDYDKEADEEWLTEVRTLAELVFRVRSAEGWRELATTLAREGETVLVAGEVDLDHLGPLALELSQDAIGLIFGDEQAQLAWSALLGEEGYRVHEFRRTI